jgi:glycosyltransferase involved in cell wall biosynthesis
MKKMCVMIYDYPLGVSTSLISILQFFAQSEYLIDIFIHEDGFNICPINFPEKEIKINVIKSRNSKLLKILKKVRIHGYIDKKIVSGTLYDLCKLMNINIRYFIFTLFYKKYENMTNDSFEIFNRKLISFSKLLIPSVFKFSKKVTQKTDNDYDAIIGIEPKGLLIAHLFTHLKKSRTPIIYFNMELLLEKECKKSRQKILKLLERPCNQRSVLTLIQDEHRAHHLIVDNSLDRKKVICIPVCSFGPPIEEKSNYLRDLFKIEKSKKIILYAGNIIEWSMCLELAESAKKWSDDYVLVLHTWRHEAKNEDYVKKIIALADNSKIFLSFNPLEYSDLSKLISSADFGVIFYKNIGENFFNTGNSSNKLAQYLQFGLPVITIDFPSFKEIIEKYDCGKCINNPEDIERMATAINLQYGYYRKNAFECYRENYDISKYFRLFEKKIEENV